MMLRWLAVGVLSATVLAAVDVDVRAQNYPWCANFADGAGTNCGFATYQQCMATSMGSGGTCTQNNLYQPTGQAKPSRRPPHKRSAKRP